MPDVEFEAGINDVLDSYDFDADQKYELAYGLYGFNAPAGSNPVEFGKSLFEYQRQYGEFPDTPDSLKFSFDYKEFCPLSGGQACIDDLLGKVNEAPGLMNGNVELLSRYENLQQYSSLREPFTARELDAMGKPPESDVYLLEASSLLKVHMLYLVSTGQADQAWQLLDDELSFHRNILLSSSGAFKKELARKLIEDDVRLRVLLVSLGIGDSQSRLELQRLTAEERSMKPVLHRYIVDTVAPILNESENVVISENFQFYWLGRVVSSDFGSFWITAMFKIASEHPKLSSNRQLDKLVELLQIEDGSAAEFEAWLAPISDQGQNANLFTLVKPLSSEPLLYLHGAERDVRRYYDLDRFIVLAQIAERILDDSISSSSVENWLANVEPDLHDPLTGLSARWENDVLRFDNGIGEEQRAPLELPLSLPE